MRTLLAVATVITVLVACVEEPVTPEPEVQDFETADLDGDGDVDRDDLDILLSDRGNPVAASACGAPCDLDGDGEITALDSRALVLLCTLPHCVIPAILSVTALDELGEALDAEVEILVDGVRIGMTNGGTLTAKLAPGTRLVEAVEPEIAGSAQEVVLESDQVSNLTLEITGEGLAERTELIFIGDSPPVAPFIEVVLTFIKQDGSASELSTLEFVFLQPLAGGASQNVTSQFFLSDSIRVTALDPGAFSDLVTSEYPEGALIEISASTTNGRYAHAVTVVGVP